MLSHQTSLRLSPETIEHLRELARQASTATKKDIRWPELGRALLEKAIQRHTKGQR